MTRHKTVCLGILLGCALAGPARAAEFNMSVTTGDVKLGTSIMGPKLSEADLKGKVVLLEFWGIN